MKKDEIFVVAEIGKNFIQTKEDKIVEEYLENAKKLVDAAVSTGADAVKFQTHEVEDEQLNIDITSPHFSGSDRYSWVKRNTEATPFEFWRELKDYCDSKGITFFSTPMSRKAATKLEQIGVPFWKVGSGDADDFVMLDYMVQTGKPIMISSGMVSLSELDKIMSYLKENKVEITLFYCVSLYPCPPEMFNLGTLEYFKEKYPWARLGFSDHSLGDEVVLSAIKLGARVIEKHFSLSRNFWGPDHKVSMEPEEMKRLIQKIRGKEYEKVDTQSFYGEKDRELEGADNMFRKFFKKGLVAGKDLPPGSTLNSEDVWAMRPLEYIERHNGLPSSKLRNICGKNLRKDLKKFEPISKDDIV